ncbi:MAG: metal-sensing transcriptional repressor, partial [Lachnospiraceae bacterium]|nr:metal-sensing transcriptional repressor [Lachnospiraceae bacterium]
MLTAALLELIPDPDGFIRKMNTLGLPGVTVKREKAVSCGITGTHVSVVIDGEEEESHDVDMQGHEHDHDHDHEHDHDHAHEHDHAHGHHGHTHTHEHTKAVLNRLSRAIGHLQSVRNMVEEGRDCSEVLIQIAAVRSAIDNTGKLILQDHLKHCIVDAAAEGDQQAID